MKNKTGSRRKQKAGAKSSSTPSLPMPPESKEGVILEYVLNALEHHHMSRPGIPTLVKQARAMQRGAPEER